MNASPPYYFAFETNADRTLTGHCVVIETKHFPDSMMQAKMAILGKDIEADPRIEKLIKHGYENYARLLQQKTPEEQVKEIRNLLELACRFLEHFPAAHLAAALTTDSLQKAVDTITKNRKSTMELFAESAASLETATSLYTKAKKELAMVKQVLDLDEIERFVKLANEIDRLSKDGLFDRLRAFNHEMPTVP